MGGQGPELTRSTSRAAALGNQSREEAGSFIFRRSACWATTLKGPTLRLCCSRCGKEAAEQGAGALCDTEESVLDQAISGNFNSRSIA